MSEISPEDAIAASRIIAGHIVQNRDRLLYKEVEELHGISTRLFQYGHGQSD